MLVWPLYCSDDTRRGCLVSQLLVFSRFFPSTSWQQQFRLLDCYRGNSPRAQRGSSGGRATLFTARFWLRHAPTCFTCAGPLCHVYFKPSHQEVHNCRLHGNDAGRVTRMEIWRTCGKVKREKKGKKLSLLSAAGGTRVNIKAQCVQRTVPGFICKHVLQG